MNFFCIWFLFCGNLFVSTLDIYSWQWCCESTRPLLIYCRRSSASIKRNVYRTDVRTDKPTCRGALAPLKIKVTANDDPTLRRPHITSIISRKINISSIIILSILSHLVRWVDERCCGWTLLLCLKTVSCPKSHEASYQAQRPNDPLRTGRRGRVTTESMTSRLDPSPDSTWR